MLLQSHCAGALDGKELFAIEGSENWRSTPDDLEERENGLKKRPKNILRRHNPGGNIAGSTWDDSATAKKWASDSSAKSPGESHPPTLRNSILQPGGPEGLRGPGWRAQPILSIQTINPQKYLSDFLYAEKQKQSAPKNKTWRNTWSHHVSATCSVKGTYSMHTIITRSGLSTCNQCNQQAIYKCHGHGKKNCF